MARPGRMTNTEIRQARVGGELTPGKLAMKILKLVLDAHIKLDPELAAQLPASAWPEIAYRLLRLRERIDAFLDEPKLDKHVPPDYAKALTAVRDVLAQDVPERLLASVSEAVVNRLLEL